MSKFCTECGAPRAVGAKFCTSCGVRLSPAEATATTSSVSAAPVSTERSVLREPQASRRHLLLAAAGGLAVAAVVAAVVVATGGGEEAGSDPVTNSAGATETVDVGVAEVAAPDPVALIVDESGVVVPGDQVLVTLRDGADRDAAERVASIVSGEVVGQIEFINLWQIRIPPTDLAGLEAVIDSLLVDDDVELAAPNATSTFQEEIWGERLDPMRDPTYAGKHGDGFRMIGVEAAWHYLRGSGLPRHAVKIGVTDSGLYRGTDPNLSEFPTEREGAVSVEFPDPDAGDIDPENVPARWADDVASGAGSHGTGVLTVLAGNPDDGGAYGVAGNLGDDLTVSYTDVGASPYGSGSSVVPESPPVDGTDPGVTTTTPVEHVTWSNGVTYTIGNFKAIVDQIRGGARVINMSWGTKDSRGNPSTALMYRRFFERLAERHPGVLFVASAGNDGISVDGSRRWPSGLALPNMVTVGNLENDGSTRASSNRASWNFEVTLAAPGNGAVRGFRPDGTPIADGGGTSNAAPQVSGAAALLLSIKPDLTAAQIKELLTSTARTSITRSDGTDHAIAADVGGRVLAIDLAVFELIKEERLRLGLDEPNPDGSSPLTPDQLLGHGVVDSVAISTDAGWTVRGIVAGCAPNCTSVAISVSEGSAVAGDTTQVLTSPGEATWSVTFTELPGTIVVRRTDNGAGSRILIPEESAPLDEGEVSTTTVVPETPSTTVVADGVSPFDGTWVGEAVLDVESETYERDREWFEAWGLIDRISWVISATPDGAVEIETNLTAPVESIELQGGKIDLLSAWGEDGVRYTYSGSLSPDGSTITGTFSVAGSLPHPFPEPGDADPGQVMVSLRGTFTASRS